MSERSPSQTVYRWTVAPGFKGNPDALLASPGEVIKQSGRAKSVTRHAHADGAFYVKRYRHDAVAARPLKYLFKPSQAREEWRLAAELEKRGVPAVHHVALGERWSALGLLESVLITKAFDGVPLGDAPQFDLKSVVELIRTMASAHLGHRDFHPANLLVNERTGELRLVDLYGMRVAEEVPVEQLERELLGQLCITTRLPVPKEIADYGHRLRKEALAKRSRRCLHNNRDFARRHIGGRKWHLRLQPPGLRQPAGNLNAVLNNPDEFLRRARVLKAGRSSTVGAADGVVVKRFNFTRWLRPLKDLFRTPRAVHAFRKAYHLELCGIPTAIGIAAANDRRAGAVTRGFFVMAEISGATDVRSWRGDLVPGARSVGKLIGKLHHEGFSHRDLKETNILFDASGAPHLIDLEGLTFEGDVPHSAAAANLERLARGAAAAGKLNRQSAIAFLLGYCRARKLTPRALFPR